MEMGYLLFQITLFAYILATSGYTVYFWSQRKEVRTAARRILIGAGVLHTLYLIVRYFEAGHTPLSNHHETISFFALSLTWGYLSFHWRYNVRNLGTFVSPLITILMLIATFSSREITPLPPVLKSLWLPVHASIAIMAYGFLALAFCGGIMYLLQERELKKKRFGLFYARLPSLEALDQLNSHCLAVGFPLLTLGIITGTIWSKQTWGTYWQWDPKETWSLVTWLFYAALLHQRFTVGWRGRRAAIMTIIGFSVAMFTLWGVTYLLGGVHSYVG
jgi:cytochrome c-type biogenesis protein CcsB